MNTIKQIPRSLSVLCLFLASICSVQSQAADLLEVYQKARDADPQFRSAGFDHQASREVLTQAWSGYRPSIALSYDRSKTRQEIRESDNVLFNTGSTSFPTSVVTLSLTQPVFRYANYLRIGQAHSELKQADAELANSEQELMLRVAETYINALAAADNLAFLQAEHTALEQQLELASARQKAKLGRMADRLEAEARLASVGADYAEAEVNLHDAYEALSEMTGEYPGTLNQLIAQFPMIGPSPADADHWVEAAMKQNWELEAQRQAMEVSNREIAKQKAEHYPTLDLRFQNTINDTGGTLFGGGSEVETRELMLSLNIPIYQGGSTSSRTREAAYRHESNREELTRLSRKVRRESQRTFSDIVNAIKRATAREKEVMAQEEVLKFKQAGYKAALSTNLSVLDAERDLYSAKRDYSRARYDYLLNSLKLKAVVGTLSEADLVGLNNWLTSEPNAGRINSSTENDETRTELGETGLVMTPDEAEYRD